MKLRELTDSQLRELYEGEMRRAFPPDELKPLRAMEGLRAQGKYDALGLWEGEQLLGYAMMWREPDCPFVLLDYLGTMERARGQGLGSRLLGMLREHYPDCRGIYAEVEAPENGAPEGEALRLRRLDFYHRNGFRYGGYDCALFGVHYRTLIMGDARVPSEQLLKAHQDIYGEYMPKHIYQRFIQLPLHPGQKVKPAGEWVED